MKSFIQIIRESTGIDVDKITKSMTMSDSDAAYSGMSIVWVKTKVFDKAWKRDKNFYIGPGGTGNSIGKRYDFFLDLLHKPEEERKQYLGMESRKNRNIATSSVNVSDTGQIGFNNGRHRYAVLRDLGAKKIPVAMTPVSAKYAKEFNYI